MGWGLSSKCSWVIQVSHSVDWSPSVVLLSFIYAQQGSHLADLGRKCPDRTLIWTSLWSRREQGGGSSRKK